MATGSMLRMQACQESENAAIFEAQMPYGIRMKLVFHMVYSASAEVFHYNEQDLYQWRMVCRGQCLQQCQVGSSDQPLHTDLHTSAGQAVTEHLH